MLAHVQSCCWRSVSQFHRDYLLPVAHIISVALHHSPCNCKSIWPFGLSGDAQALSSYKHNLSINSGMRVFACAYLTRAVWARLCDAYIEFWITHFMWSCVSAPQWAKSIQRGRKAIRYESVITGNHNRSCSPLKWGEFNYLPLPVLGKTFWWKMDVRLQ